MKSVRKKVMATLLLFCAILSFTACNAGNEKTDGIFPGVDDADIPDVLEMTVGTLGNTYYSSGIKDNKDYDSILTVTFEDTTDADYTALLEHYQTTSTGTDDNGSLLFDWGYLQMTSDNGTIQITAYIKLSLIHI